MQVPNPAASLAGEVRLEVADLDNNGALDLILSPIAPLTGQPASTPLIWLGDAASKFTLLAQSNGAQHHS